MKPRSASVRIVLPSCLAAVLALPCAGAAAAADVHLSIVRAKASGERQAGAPLEVDGKLEPYRRRLEALNTRHAAFRHDGGMERDAAWGDTVDVPIDGGGKLALSASPSKSPGQVILNVAETAPGAKAPCLQSSFETGPRSPATVFCDRVPETGTVIFFVSAEPKAK